MTVTYTGDVANASSFGCFWKILLRWKGSVYKLIWRELLAYLALYFTINLIYRYAMDTSQKEIFEKLVVYCSKQISSIPLTFVLGFYVSLVVKRWWDQYWYLPLPDSLALYISASIHGQDERARILRRTIMRYAMLSFIIMLQRVSVRVKKRFPTLQHLVDAGMMMDCEKKILDRLEAKTSVSKFWVPAIWASNLVTRARKEGRISSDHMLQTILTELSEFRRKLGLIIIFDHVSVPLVYTQVVTLAVYTYFTAAVVGRQWLEPVDSTLGYELDLYFPIFLPMQFMFYIGWLKVAETLINPFGEDDDDYEMNWLIDRHIQVSYMVVDEIHDDHPELLKDYYWDQVVPRELPYNEASNLFRRFEPKGSTASMKIKEKESIYDKLPGARKRRSITQEDVYEVVQQQSSSPRPKNWFQRQLTRVESSRRNPTGFPPDAFNVMDETGGGHPRLGNASPRRLSISSLFRGRKSSKENIPAEIHSNTLSSNGSTKSGPRPSPLMRGVKEDVKRNNQINKKKPAILPSTGAKGLQALSLSSRTKAPPPSPPPYSDFDSSYLTPDIIGIPDSAQSPLPRTTSTIEDPFHIPALLIQHESDLGTHDPSSKSIDDPKNPPFYAPSSDSEKGYMTIEEVRESRLGEGLGSLKPNEDEVFV